MNDERIRKIETDIFQGRIDEATDSALDVISALDMDDDDDAAVAEGLIPKILGSAK